MPSDKPAPGRPKLTPQRIARLQKGNDPDAAVFIAGQQDGFNQARKVALNFLEAAYLGPDRPDRDSPEAGYLLDLARRISAELKEAELRGLK